MEDELILLYQELKEDFLSISENDAVAIQDKKRISSHLRDLRAQALELDIDLEKELVAPIVDRSDNWLQFIKAAYINDLVRDTLIDVINDSEDKPTEREVLSMLKTLEKFHKRYFVKAKPSADDFDELKEIGQTINMEHCRKSAIAAALKEIGKAPLSNWQISYGLLESNFEDFWALSSNIPKEVENYKLPPDPLDDVLAKTYAWESIVDNAACHENIRALLKEKIESITTNPNLKKVLTIVKLIDKYYEANALNPKHLKVSKKYKEIFGRDLPEDKAEQEAAVLHFQKSAFAAIMDGIELIDEDLSINPEEDFHNPFVDYYKKKKPLPQSSSVPIPHQYKFDFLQESWGKEKAIGFLRFGEPTVQASIKIGFTKSANLYNSLASSREPIGNAGLFSNFVDQYYQFVRSTITLGSITKGFSPKIGTTAFTQGKVLGTFPIGNVILKTDLGNINWYDYSKPKEDKLPSLALGSIRAQLNVDLVKVKNLVQTKDIFASLDEGIAIQPRSVFSVSFGFTITMDYAKFIDFVADNYKPKVNPKIKSTPTIDPDDAKELEKLKNKAKQLEDKASELKDLIQKNKAKSSKFGQAAREFQTKAKDFFKGYKDRIWNSELGQEAAEKLMRETGEQVAKRMGRQTLTAVAKTLGRAIPVVGAVMTVVEVATLIYDLYTFFSTPGWEQYFIDFGSWLESKVGFID